MAKCKPLKCRGFLKINGEPVPWFEIDENGKTTYFLPPEATREKVEEMLKRAGQTMSEYMSTHPDCSLWSLAQ